MAGLTTCLWQAFPEVNNMSIINVMQQAATRATNPDDRIGYGIPDMKKAFVKLIKQVITQQSRSYQLQRQFTMDCKNRFCYQYCGGKKITCR